VFDERGAPCTVLAATEPMLDHEVFDVVFDDGSVIRADAGHRWLTVTTAEVLTGHRGRVRTTKEICDALVGGTAHAIDLWVEHGTTTPANVTCKRINNVRRRIIEGVRPVPTEPVRCIKVDAPSHLFLAGESMIPTHNSDALLVDALQFATGNHPQYGHLAKHHRALLLRRSFVDLTRYIIPRSQVLYPQAGGVWRASTRRWHFPSGATIELGACDNAENIHRFAGAAYNWIGFDELTHFTLGQYLFLLSRLRSAAGLPTYYRSASNPGGPGHDWVLARFAPWLRGNGKDPDYDGPSGEECKPLFFYQNKEGEDLVVPKGTRLARGRSFIPATVHDNPFLANSEYLANMNAMSLIDRLRIMHGDWLVKPAAGAFFKKKWFENKFVRERQLNAVVRLRYWDLAGTEEARAKEGTAWTAGVLLSGEVVEWGADGTPIVRVCVEDVKRGQWHPLGVLKAIDEALEQDQARDPDCYTYIERDPGQAGKFQSWFTTARAATLGHALRMVPPQGSKLTRARTPSAHVEQGLVTIFEAKWNKIFLEELEGFPEGLKDQVDAFTGGFIQLMMLARSSSGGRAAKVTKTEHNPQRNQRRGGF